MIHHFLWIANQFLLLINITALLRVLFFIFKKYLLLLDPLKNITVKEVDPFPYYFYYLPEPQIWSCYSPTLKCFSSSNCLLDRSAGAMLESNWVRVCELEERSLNVSHCWTDRGETSQHDEKDGVKDHRRRFSKVIQRLHCKLCFVGLTKFRKFCFSINILRYLCWVIL